MGCVSGNKAEDNAQPTEPFALPACSSHLWKRFLLLSPENAAALHYIATPLVTSAAEPNERGRRFRRITAANLSNIPLLQLLRLLL